MRTCSCSCSMSERRVSTRSTGFTPPGTVRPTSERDSRNNDGSAKRFRELRPDRRWATETLCYSPRDSRTLCTR